MVNAWNGLAGKIMADPGVDRFKFELHRHQDKLEMERYEDIVQDW